MPVGSPQLPGQGNMSNRLRNTQNNNSSKTRKPVGGKKGAGAALPPLDPASTANYYAQLQGLYGQYRNTLSALKAQRVGLQSGLKATKASIGRERQLGLIAVEGDSISRGMLGSSVDVQGRLEVRAQAAQAVAQARNETQAGLADLRIQAQQAATDYFMGAAGVESSALAQRQADLANDMLNNLIVSGQEASADILKQIYESMSGGGAGGGGKAGKGRLPFTTPMSSGPTGAKIINFARSQEGVPYVFGAKDPKGGGSASFDCSGFTSWAVAQATGGSLQLPHSAAAQSKVLPKISKQELRPGDLLFFGYGSGRYGEAIDHVGIYLGGGRMIDTSSPDRRLGARAVDWDNFLQGGRTPHGKWKVKHGGSSGGIRGQQ